MAPPFVDIHSHVLYGLDDGAKTREESVEMLRMAAAAGTTDIVATPHATSRFPFRPELIAQQIAELQPLTQVRIHRGCDFHLQYDNIQDALAHPAKYTVNGGPYLLVEFPEMSIFSGTDDILSQLLDAGMLPIVTHPERNTILQRHVRDLARWVEMGCYVQVTAGSILGGFGGRARASAFELLERGLVQFVASDGHDVKHRVPRLDEAYAALSERYGEGTMAGLFGENPAAVVRGEVLAFERRTMRPAKRWFEFWK